MKQQASSSGVAGDMGVHPMAELEQIEMARYRAEVIHDLRHLVKKYCRIMAWEVPELDEKRANHLILDAMRGALAEVARDLE